MDAIRGSSMAERSAVNREVVGSSPTPGALLLRRAAVEPASVRCATTPPPAPPPARRRRSPPPRRRSPARAPRTRGRPAAAAPPSRIAPGRVSRHGTAQPGAGPRDPRPVLAPCRRPPGSTSTGTPAASARATVPCPPWQITSAASRHHLRVGEPVDHARVRAAPRSALGRHRAVRRRQHPHRLVGQRLERQRRTSRRAGSWAVLGATTTSGPSPAGSSTSG